MTAYISPAPPEAADVVEALTRLDGDAVVTFDGVGTVTSATASAADVFGTDLVGRPITDVWPAETVAHVLAGEVVPEAVEICEDGRRTTQGAPLRSADGRVVGGLVRGRRVNTELPTYGYPEASEQGLRVFRASAVPTCITDADGRHLAVNDAFCELLGRTEAELLASGIDATSPPEEAEGNHAHLEMLRSSRTSHVRTKKLLRADGTIIWGEVCATPVVVPETGAIELIVQVRDVTQSVLDREELLEQRLRLDASQEAGRVGTWEIDFVSGRPTWSRHAFLVHLLEPSDRTPPLEETLARVHEDDRAALVGVTTPRDGAYDFEVDFRLIGDDGDVRVLRTRGRHTPSADGGPGVLRGTTLDVTEEVTRIRALEKAEERLRRAFDTSLLGIAVIDADGIALQVNEALSRMLGQPQEQLIGGSSVALTHPDDRAEQTRAVRRVLTGEADSFVLQTRYRHASGQYVWVEVAGAPMDAACEEFVVQVRDVTESRRQRQKLQFLADHDPLTGVLNRRAFDREVVSHLGRVLGGPHQDAGALLVLDLDNFKQQNDAFGHAFGDALLVAVAGAIRAQVGPGDSVARIGGDEFAVLLTRASGSEAAETAKQVLDAIGRAVDDLPGDPDAPVGASLGMAIPHADDGLDTLLQRADARMYAMKSSRSPKPD